MSTVTELKRRTHSELCLHPSTSVTHSTAQPTLTQKFSGSNSPLLISHCFTLFHSFCVSRVPGKQENVMKWGGWECISAVLTVCTASGGWYLRSISMETHEASVIICLKDYTLHTVWCKTTHNCFHSEEDLKNISPPISRATAKVTDSWKMSKPLLQYTIFIYPG